MMHEPIQAKGPTMSEQLMEQYRLRGQRKCRNACIAAIVTVVLVLAVAGGVWWTAGDGSALVRNMFKPKATPATQPVVNSTATFAYRTAPEFGDGSRRPRHRQCELLSCFDVDGVGHRRAGRQWHDPLATERTAGLRFADR